MLAAMANLPIQQFVFNAFSTAYSPSELTSVISFGPRPLATLIMPPIIAKSFALAILECVEQYEKATGTKVHTVEELNERISRSEIQE
jgi:hypothetical protein